MHSPSRGARPRAGALGGVRSRAVGLDTVGLVNGDLQAIRRDQIVDHLLANGVLGANDGPKATAGRVAVNKQSAAGPEPCVKGDFFRGGPRLLVKAKDDDIKLTKKRGGQGRVLIVKLGNLIALLFYQILELGKPARPGIVEEHLVKRVSGAGRNTAVRGDISMDIGKLRRALYDNQPVFGGRAGRGAQIDLAASADAGDASLLKLAAAHEARTSWHRERPPAHEGALRV